MARGWDSKAIEDQISEKESQANKTVRARLTPAEAIQREKLDSLVLARSRTMANLESARNARYRTLLERTLEHLAAQIADIQSAT